MVVKSGGVKCLFCAEAERLLFVILVGCEKVSSCLSPGIYLSLVSD